MECTFFLTITINTYMRRAVLPSISCWLMPLSHQIIKPNLPWFTRTLLKRIFFSERNSKLSKRSITTNLIWYISLTSPAKAGKVSACQKSHKSFLLMSFYRWYRLHHDRCYQKICRSSGSEGEDQSIRLRTSSPSHLSCWEERWSSTRRVRRYSQGIRIHCRSGMV